MFSSIDVHNYLVELDIPHEIFKLTEPVRSVERAAPALGLSLDQIAGVRVYRVDGEPVIVIAPASKEIDGGRLAGVCGGKEIERAREDEVPMLTGYLGGYLPPVAHKEKMQAYIDYYILKEDVVYTGAGEPTAILKIRSYDMVRATGGEIGELIAPPS